MGKIWMPGGSYTDLDVTTAGPGDVLAGKVIVDKDGNPLTGNMPDRGAWTSRIGVNGKAVIPAGYHNGSGYVDQAINDRGAVNASLAINGTYVIPEGYHNGAGKVTQSIDTMGAQTISPGTSAKTLYCSGKYMTGNVTVPAVSIPASYIKKGQVITFPDGSKVTGMFEGWVAGNGDIYNQGAMGLANGFTVIPRSLPGEGINWITTVPCKMYYEIGCITLRAGYEQVIISDNAINLSGWNALNIEFLTNTRGDYRIGVSANKVLYSNENRQYDAHKMASSLANTRNTVSLDIQNINAGRYVVFGKYAGGVSSDNKEGLDGEYTYIYRIWLSQ